MHAWVFCQADQQHCSWKRERVLAASLLMSAVQPVLPGWVVWGLAHGHAPSHSLPLHILLIWTLPGHCFVIFVLIAASSSLVIIASCIVKCQDRIQRHSANKIIFIFYGNNIIFFWLYLFYYTLHRVTCRYCILLAFQNVVCWIRHDSNSVTSAFVTIPSVFAPPTR